MANELGVYQAYIELAPLAARTTDGTGTAVDLKGKRFCYNVVCEYTAKATNANDTMDVYVDVLVGATWINVVRFTTALGNGTDAQVECATIGPATTNTTVTNLSAALASGAVRPGVFGSQIRARWDITDGGGAGDPSFTFSVIAYAI